MIRDQRSEILETGDQINLLSEVRVAFVTENRLTIEWLNKLNHAERDPNTWTEVVDYTDFNKGSRLSY